MVAPPLVEPYIEEGWKLIEALRDHEFGLDAAYWSYLEEPDLWRLILVSRAVEEIGTTEAYRRVQEALPASSSLVLDDVAVQGGSRRESQAIVKGVRFRAGEATRRIRGTVGREYFDDILVYNLSAVAWRPNTLREMSIQREAILEGIRQEAKEITSRAISELAEKADAIMQVAEERAQLILAEAETRLAQAKKLATNQGENAGR